MKTSPLSAVALLITLFTAPALAEPPSVSDASDALFETLNAPLDRAAWARSADLVDDYWQVTHARSDEAAAEIEARRAACTEAGRRVAEAERQAEQKRREAEFEKQQAEWKRLMAEDPTTLRIGPRMARMPKVLGDVPHCESEARTALDALDAAPSTRDRALESVVLEGIEGALRAPHRLDHPACEMAARWAIGAHQTYLRTQKDNDAADAVRAYDALLSACRESTHRGDVVFFAAELHFQRRDWPRAIQYAHRYLIGQPAGQFIVDAVRGAVLACHRLAGHDPDTHQAHYAPVCEGAKARYIALEAAYHEANPTE